MALIKVKNGQKYIIAEKNITEHNKLDGRDSYGCHPIDAIRGLPEKLTKLKEKDAELEEVVNLLTTDSETNITDIANIKTSLTQAHSKIDDVKENVQKIDIVENNDSTFTFTNYGGVNSKTIQSGFLPDKDTLDLNDNKQLVLNKIYSNSTLFGTGIKENPLSVNIDNTTISKNNNGSLYASSLKLSDNTILTGDHINNELSELNKDIGDLTTQINKDYQTLTTKNTEQDEAIKKLENKALGVGGYLPAYNFKKATPTQDELTNYALQQLSISEQTQIPDQTRVKNLYDNVVWILNNHSINGVTTFNWINDGKDTIGLATEDTAGLVKGSSEDYQGSVDINGHITINNLSEYISSNDNKINTINTKLDDVALLGEANIFTELNTFNQETVFNASIEVDNHDVNVTNGFISLTDEQKDTVTKYTANSININENNETTNHILTLPKETGTLVTSNTINLKNSVIKNIDTEQQKEETWITSDPDSIISLTHENDTTNTSVSVQKGFAEISSLGVGDDTTNSSIGVTSNSIVLTSAEAKTADAKNTTLAITPDGAQINNEKIITETDFDKKLDKVETTSSFIRAYGVQADGSQTLLNIEDNLNTTSTNPVQNKIIKKALDDKLNILGVDEVNRVYVRKQDGVDSSLPYVYTAEADSIVYRNASGQTQVETPNQDEDATNKKYVDNALSKKQDKLTAGDRIVIENNVIKSVVNSIDLSGEDGTLDDSQYSLIERDDQTIIRRSSIIYRLNSKPIEGSGDYVFISDYYDTGEIKSYKPYAIVLKQDKTWKWEIINGTQSDEASLPVFLTLNSKDTATNGELTKQELALLQSTNDAHIIFNNERYDLQDIQHTSGTLTFTHKGLDTLHHFFTKCITITLSTKAWTLIEQGTDDEPIENSNNLITSGAIFTLANTLANADGSNIIYEDFANKLNVDQSFTKTPETNVNVIRFGSLLFMSKTIDMVGNTEETFNFPIQFSDTPIMCWCNSTANGSSSNNSAAVTSYNNLSMTVRICGADSSVSFFAFGWKSN